MKKADKTPVSSGVEQLIERLRHEGVEAGEQQAAKIVEQAKKRADAIVQQAQLEAEKILKQTHEQSRTIQQAGEDALKLATRDAVIKLRDTLLNSFSQEVARTVSQKMEDQELLARLIIELAGQVRQKIALDQRQAVEIYLPEAVMGVEELKQNPEELAHGLLSRLTSDIAEKMLRQGVTIHVDSALDKGIVIQLQDEKIRIDFTDETVSDLLLAHLQPRFRALLQGIVK
jgi:V/A-type H+-transporting ATPase subunit E